VSLRRKTI